MSGRSNLLTATILIPLLVLVPLVATALNEPFYIDVARRVMIIAIAAISLDLILGHAGMISFGHALYLGFGAYSVGILSIYGVHSGLIQWPTAIVTSAAIAGLVGIVSLRTSGVYFIMITLAFSQMFYFLAVSMKGFGGDDGMTLPRRSRLPGLDLDDGVVFYYVVFVCLMAVIYMIKRLVNSRFGIVLQGIKQNEVRMRAIGVHTQVYKLAAFVIAGALCGLAGALMANQTEYFSPDFMHWSRSGDLLVIVVLGGSTALFGPLVGAAVFVVMEVLLAGFTKHWHLIFGPLLLVLAVTSRGGILDLFSANLGWKAPWWPRTTRKRGA